MVFIAQIDAKSKHLCLLSLAKENKNKKDQNLTFSMIQEVQSSLMCLQLLASIAAVLMQIILRTSVSTLQKLRCLAIYFRFHYFNKCVTCYWNDVNKR